MIYEIQKAYAIMLFGIFLRIKTITSGLAQGMELV